MYEALFHCTISTDFARGHCVSLEQLTLLGLFRSTSDLNAYHSVSAEFDFCMPSRRQISSPCELSAGPCACLLREGRGGRLWSWQGQVLDELRHTGHLLSRLLSIIVGKRPFKCPLVSTGEHW
ncbi:hypothetical protein BD626DRAFT_101425 [Schizophyllum amplum]|uniref:Uncharacterized protein n=1 Tax=Schizophyllum amplum TaxID=97359 RepID=A0A550CRR3_9AGAR|nr:hypothetical protein BD626DRAFT_101425 [Auriculariopsis ampla]